MIPLTPHGRRAEEFHALLEGGDSTGRERDAELLELVGALRTTPEVTPRPDYVVDLRERLMAEADLVLSDVERKLTLPTTGRSKRDRRVAIAAGAIALVGVSSSVAFASQGALPGDTLYPIKRAIEGASTSLAFNDATKGERMLDNASGRLAEIEQLAQRSSVEESQVRDTLSSFTTQSRDAADLLLGDYADSGSSQGVEKLRTFASSSIETLSALSERLPSGTRDALENAVNTLIDIDNLANEACPGCSGGIGELPATLAALTASEVEVEKTPAPQSPLVMPDYTYTDESSVGDTGASDESQSTQQQPQPTTPPKNPGDDKGEKKPKDSTIKKTTKDLGDLLAGDKSLLGDDGVVPGLLDSLLGNEGVVGGLLGGRSSSEEE